jgi:hypothetical protein
MAAGSIGSSLSQPPVTILNTGNAITKKYFTPLLADSIFKPSPMWWSMTRLGKKLRGGGAIVWPNVTSEETTGGAYWGVQKVDTTPTDSTQPAELQWKGYQQAIVIPIMDALLNEGEGEVLNLVKVKDETAMGSLLQKLSRAVQGVAPQNTSIDLDPVTEALGVLGGSYAGITLAAPWASNGGLGPSSGGPVDFGAMMSDYMAASQGNEQPDRIFMTAAGYTAFWNLLTQQQRQIEDSETIRAGFRMHFMFNNSVVMWDGFVPAGEIQMLTSKYVRALFHTRDYFSVDPFVQPTDQRVIISHIWVLMNLQFLTLRQCARRTGVTNG